MTKQSREKPKQNTQVRISYQVNLQDGGQMGVQLKQKHVYSHQSSDSWVTRQEDPAACEGAGYMVGRAGGANQSAEGEQVNQIS